TLEGAASKIISTTVTDTNGAYTFNGLGYDTYTITPSRDGYGFDPPSQTKVITAATAGTTKSFTLSNFIAFQGYQISGVVLDITKPEGQAGIPGITIQLSGTTTDGTSINLSKVTDSEGKYSFTELSNGTYTIMPVSSGYNFEPASQSVTIASANVLNINFYAGTGFSISGTISKSAATTDNESLTTFSVELFKDNATLILTPLSKRTALIAVTPDAKGNFVFIGVPPGSYIVKPKKAGYGFDPLQYNVTIRTKSLSDLFFTATKGLYISGKVVNPIGLGQAGISIELTGTVQGSTTGTSTSTVTNQDGNYAFTGLSSGDYIVAIADEMKGYYQTLPTNRRVSLTTEGREDLNFVVRSLCSTVYVVLPFFGVEGTPVHILGTNFGWSEPLDNETVSVTIGDQSDTIPAGVYFGTEDLSTWVKAEVMSWTPVKISVKVPPSSLRIPLSLVKVWVVRSIKDTDVTATDSDFAGCFDGASTDFFLYLY
ncbi:MAG: carboxypeptidase regulatory-like domain-containing protein, partial [Desulfobacterota bacterium]|nr:carboxypeptidase regulatory-like domain-containing protein [Thermodesulfobacteriota bacterium]